MSKIWTVADDIDFYNLDSIYVEEIEGKGSPIENPDSPNESSSQGQSDGGHRGHMGDHMRRGVGRGHEESSRNTSVSSHSDLPPDRQSDSTTKTHDSSRSPSESPATRYGSKSNQRWMKLRTTVQLSGAISSTIQKKAPLKREDSFLKRFSTRQIPEAQETFEIGDDDGGGTGGGSTKITRKKKRSLPRTVVNPDGNFYFYWLMLLTFCVLYNLWTLIVRQSFPELQAELRIFWIITDAFSDLVFVLDIAVQFRTGYLEQGLMVYKTKKLAKHYIGSRPFYLDFSSLLPTDLLQIYLGTNPMLRFPRFLKVYRIYNYYYMVESRTVYPNVWRVVNLIHILLLLAHWFGCFYFVLSKAENFIGQWSFPNPKNNTDFDSLTRKYLASLYWSTLTLTTIGDLPTPYSNWQYLFTIVSYLIGVFIFATIVGQVGNVITNRNANRLEFERLLDGAKMYMRHHKVPRDMQRRVLRWYDYSWSRGRIQGGGDINTALGLLPDKLKTELALHVNLSVLKKVTIFQECQPEFLHDLVLKMKAYIFTPGDLICRKGEVAREMFIIADGILEVISEMGKVLTTMQAGDFFGEIGILNLDGLNKRTADVRSVGYSELFSLSREDVLAAMKDYPEAQEILQTLGRKRLMEARKASAPASSKRNLGTEVKKAPPLSSHLSLAPSQSSLSHKGPDTSETDNTSKKIVEKLRSDVRGLRNAIRRSRKSNSSKEDSSEPESGKDKSDSCGGMRSRKESMSQDSKSSLSSSARGVLKRMHHVVLSDDKDKDKDGGPSGTSPSSGAPLMTKRVSLSATGSGTAADDESVGEQAEGESQVIGAGLPLIQRLRLLKKKEEKQARAAVVVPTAGSSLEAAPAASSQRTSITGMDGNVLQTKVSIETPPKIDKESGKLSTNDSSVPGTVAGGAEVVPSSHTSKSDNQETAAELRSPPFMPLHLNARRSTVTSISSNDTADSAGADVVPLVAAGNTSRQDSSSSESNSLASRASGHPERPSMLKLKQKKTYGSVDDLSPEFARLPFIKKLKILNERQKIAELLTTKSSNTVLTRSTSEGSNETPVPGGNESTMHSVLMGRRTQSSSEQYTSEIAMPPPLPPDHPLFFLPPLTPSNDNEPDDSSATNCLNYKQDNFTSPSTTATTTITCPSYESNSVPSNISSVNLTSTNGRFAATATTSSVDGAVISSVVPNVVATTNSKSSDKGSRDSPSPPASPESNETPERRNLKSILKKLAEESASVESSEDETGKGGSGGSGSSSGTNKSSSSEYHQLLRAPTIEGYAARHRKFAKNVTFQRQQAVAVVSPEGVEGTAMAEPSQEGKADDVASGSAAIVPLPVDRENVRARLSAYAPLNEGNVSNPQNLEAVLAGLGMSQEEYIGGVYLGIRSIIESTVEEMQMKFSDKFTTLEAEVRQRDEIIGQLQHRILELEVRSNSLELLEKEEGYQSNNHIRQQRSSSSPRAMNNDEPDLKNSEVDPLLYHSDEQLSQVHSYLFSRDNSVDTVISNQDFEDDDVFVPSSDTEQASVKAHHITQVLQYDQRKQDKALAMQQSTTKWAAEISQEETIEMTEFPSSMPLWELEFHRDSASSSRNHAGTSDSVAVDIGSTSTEYDSSSSSDEDTGRHSGRKRLDRSDTVIERPLAKLGHTSGDEEDNEEDEDEDNSESSSEESVPELTNQNWEVQMLAKEMEKREDKTRGGQSVEKGELQELEMEIRQMQDAVTKGTLSPTELDMLEAVLETKTKRIKGLYKAYSVEASATPQHGPSSRLLSTKAKVGRSVDDFRMRPTAPQNLLVASRDSSARSSKTLSPGERRDLQKLIFSRKRGGVKRQASLCESTSGWRKDPRLTPSSSSGAAMTTSFSAYNKSDHRRPHHGKRRESADSVMKLPSESKSSFFSRLSFVRQFSRTLHSSKSVEETGLEYPANTKTSAIPIHAPVHSTPIDIAGEPPCDITHSGSSSTVQAHSYTSGMSATREKTGSSTLTQKSSSVGLLPLISSTISSALSASVKSDPGSTSSVPPSSSPPTIFTIPSASIPAAQPDHHHHQKYLGESQPLLKKK